MAIELVQAPATIYVTPRFETGDERYAWPAQGGDHRAT